MEAVTHAKAMAAARAGVARLAAMVGPDGRFLYRYALGDPSFVSTLYSEARHVGAVWALADFERESWNMPKLSGSIDRAADYMETRLFRPYGISDALCVIDEGLIKLSGGALGVLAEAALYRRDGREIHLEQLVRLARYVALQSEGDGNFLAVRVPGPIAQPSPLRGELAVGQAVMALVVAGNAAGEARWVDLAHQAAAALARRGHGVGTTAHWLLYALEALAATHDDPWIMEYATRLAEAMIADEATARARVSTPIACQTEGLLVYARMLRASGRDASPALKRVAGNLRRQLRFHDPSGAFIHSKARPEVRIDYITHNVIGFLGYARMMREAPLAP